MLHRAHGHGIPTVLRLAVMGLSVMAAACSVTKERADVPSGAQDAVADQDVFWRIKHSSLSNGSVVLRFSNTCADDAFYCIKKKDEEGKQLVLHIQESFGVALIPTESLISYEQDLSADRQRCPWTAKTVSGKTYSGTVLFNRFTYVNVEQFGLRTKYWFAPLKFREMNEGGHWSMKEIGPQQPGKLTIEQVDEAAMTAFIQGINDEFDRRAQAREEARKKALVDAAARQEARARDAERQQAAEIERAKAIKPLLLKFPVGSTILCDWVPTFLETMGRGLPSARSELTCVIDGRATKVRYGDFFDGGAGDWQIVDANSLKDASKGDFTRYQLRRNH